MRQELGETLWKEGQSLSLRDNLFPGEETGIKTIQRSPQRGTGHPSSPGFLFWISPHLWAIILGHRTHSTLKYFHIPKSCVALITSTAETTDHLISIYGTTKNNNEQGMVCPCCKMRSSSCDLGKTVTLHALINSPGREKGMSVDGQGHPWPSFKSFRPIAMQWLCLSSL